MGLFDAAVPIAGSLFGTTFGGMLGWQDQHIGELNRNLFVTIQDKKTGTAVRGRIVSYSISNSAEWQNKFEGTDADGKFPTFSAILQSGIYSDKAEMINALEGRTLITKAQSIQVWTGLMPQEVSMEIEFRAFSNASLEVEKPIQALIKMQAPELNDNFLETASKAMEEGKASVDRFVADEPKGTKTSGNTDKTDDVLGYTPNKVSIDFLGKRFNNVDYRMENVTEAVDGLNIDSNGNRVHQIVSLTFGSSAGIMKKDVNDGSIESLFGALEGLF